MIFKIYDSSGTEFEAFDIISYELASELSAACDGLRLYLHSEKAVNDIKTVYAYEEGKKLFYGFADQVQLSRNESGYTVFIYARSSAALLVDNEAYPGEYNCPTARQLWFSHAKPFGFSFGLPEVYSSSEYIVSKGQSCFGAIDTFMQYVCGKRIYVTPENELRAFETSGNVKRLDHSALLSVQAVTDKSSVISRIDYKISSSEKYIYRLESGFAAEKGISSRKLINLSSLPAWQRDAEAQRQITQSLEDYFTVTVKLAGNADFSLADTVEAELDGIGVSGEFTVCAITRAKDSDGAETTLKLRKEIDGELINYVAEQEI